MSPRKPPPRTENLCQSQTPAGPTTPDKPRLRCLQLASSQGASPRRMRVTAHTRSPAPVCPTRLKPTSDPLQPRLAANNLRSPLVARPDPAAYSTPLFQTRWAPPPLRVWKPSHDPAAKRRSPYRCSQNYRLPNSLGIRRPLAIDLPISRYAG